jgi:hypothetical protein
MVLFSSILGYQNPAMIRLESVHYKVFRTVYLFHNFGRRWRIDLFLTDARVFFFRFLVFLFPSCTLFLGDHYEGMSSFERLSFLIVCELGKPCCVPLLLSSEGFPELELDCHRKEKYNRDDGGLGFDTSRRRVSCGFEAEELDSVKICDKSVK